MNSCQVLSTRSKIIYFIIIKCYIKIGENMDKTNGKYIIWLYNITAREFMLLYNKFPEEHFEIKQIMDVSEFNTINQTNILERPDAVVCDINTSLSENVINNIYEARSGLIKLTLNPVITDTLNGNTFQINNDEIEVLRIKKGKQVIETTTKLDYCINKIMDICQLSKINKLSYISNELATKLLKGTDVEDKLIKGQSLNSVSKEYLFKLAHYLNHMIDLKDHYTAGHCARVSLYAEALGHALNLDASELEDLILAANLHDIGKLAIPDAVITKTSRLSDLEFNLMQKHVEVGPHILPSEKFGRIQNAVRGHHEKYDGTGYPDGLKGDEIPLFAQILAIADSFDAMTSQRSYNEVKSAESAFEDLMRHTKPYGVETGLGVHYNPELVKIFIETIRNSKTIMSALEESKKQADENRKKALEQNTLKEQLDNEFKKGGK